MICDQTGFDRAVPAPGHRFRNVAAIDYTASARPFRVLCLRALSAGGARKHSAPIWCDLVITRTDARSGTSSHLRSSRGMLRISQARDDTGMLLLLCNVFAVDRNRRTFGEETLSDSLQRDSLFQVNEFVQLFEICGLVPEWLECFDGYELGNSVVGALAQQI